ncbi:MAG: DUF362 domain-containing protein [Candidatus Anammoxibacter sp.]
MQNNISRRSFLKTSLAVGTGCYGLYYLKSLRSERTLKEFKTNSLRDGIVISQVSETLSNSLKKTSTSIAPVSEEAVVKEATKRGIAALGGMDKLVSPGDKVVIKPNIAWNRKVEFAANTNPFVVAALVELCLQAGASKVKVIDNPCSTNPAPSYKNSGIESAAKIAGADVAYIDKYMFKEINIPDGKAINSWSFYEDFVFADKVDVLINVPIAKHHSTSRLTMAMKNVFGMIGGDRGKLHKDIHRKIADLNKVVKVDLTVLDAFRTLRHHGPTGGRLEDVDNSVENARKIIISKDPVAVDSFGATLFGLKGEDIGYIRESYEAGLGEIDFKQNGMETVAV